MFRCGVQEKAFHLWRRWGPVEGKIWQYYKDMMMGKLWNDQLRDDEMRKLWYMVQMLLHVRRGGSMKDFSWEPVFYWGCVVRPSRKDCTSFCFWHRAEPRKLQVLKSCTRGSQFGLQDVSSCKGGHVGGCQAIPTSPRPRLSDCQGYSRRFRGLFLVPCRVPRSICSPSFPVLLINFLDLSSRIEAGEEICSNYLDDPETTYCARSLRQVSTNLRFGTLSTQTLQQQHI